MYLPFPAWAIWGYTGPDHYLLHHNTLRLNQVWASSCCNNYRFLFHSAIINSNPRLKPLWWERAGVSTEFEYCWNCCNGKFCICPEPKLKGKRGLREHLRVRCSGEEQEKQRIWSLKSLKSTFREQLHADSTYLCHFQPCVFCHG